MDAIKSGIERLDLDGKPEATSPSSGAVGDGNGCAGSLLLVGNAAAALILGGEIVDGRMNEKVERKLEKDGDGGKRESEKNRDVGQVAPLPLGEKEDGQKVLLYPQRFGRPNCAYYMRTGRCAFGTKCRFNHPPTTAKNDQVTPGDSSDAIHAAINVESEEHLVEGQQVECRYYLMPGGCKFGKACRYGHSGEKPREQPVMLNFLGLPLRPGQRECPYYMRSGSCKFSTNCIFNHPDPTAVEGCNPPSGYQNAGSHHYVSTSSRNPSNFSQGTLNGNVSFSNAFPSYLPSIPFQPNGLGLNLEAKDYQPYAMPSFLNTSLDGTAMKVENSTNKHSQMEYPERPGQPECPYFMKTKDCKFKSACKFHHPRSRLSEVSICNLSPCGLPLRPDKEICAFYSRFGVCKYGPACKFHHPLDFSAASTAPKSLGSTSVSDNYRTKEVKIGDNKKLVEQSA